MKTFSKKQELTNYTEIAQRSNPARDFVGKPGQEF
jgi:hypothetical protein